MSIGANVLAQHLNTIVMSAFTELKKKGWTFKDGAEERILKAAALLPRDMTPIELFNNVRDILTAEREVQ